MLPELQPFGYSAVEIGRKKPKNIAPGLFGLIQAMSAFFNNVSGSSPSLGNRRTPMLLVIRYSLLTMIEGSSIVLSIRWMAPASTFDYFLPSVSSTTNSSPAE
ncbi:MAG: hypothetical protein ACU826_12605 [Gammaproteobacteria bacterium]